jgi:hypothetical protein
VISARLIFGKIPFMMGVKDASITWRCHGYEQWRGRVCTLSVSMSGLRNNLEQVLRRETQTRSSTSPLPTPRDTVAPNSKVSNRESIYPLSAFILRSSLKFKPARRTSHAEDSMYLLKYSRMQTRNFHPSQLFKHGMMFVRSRLH